MESRLDEGAVHQQSGSPLEEEATHGLERLSILASLATLLNISTDFVTALRQVLPLVVRLVGASSGWVTLRTGEG